jgi:3'-5' exoribonuclease
MEERGLIDFNVGEEFIGFCVIRKKELKHKKNGEPFLHLDLGDRSGRLSAKLWEQAEKYYKDMKVGDIVKIKGKIQTYQNRKEMYVEKWRFAHENEKESLTEFVPMSIRDIPELLKRFKKEKASIEDPFLIKLLNKVFPDDEILEKYLKTPSGKLWHHNYFYGNLEHIVCLLELTNIISMHYSEIQIDLLKTAIILHNLGNLKEFEFEGFIDYTTEGRLIGHATLGYQEVQYFISKIKDFPDDKRLQLLHLILSQSANPEKGLSNLPMTIKAVIMHSLIQLDIRTNAAQRILEKDLTSDSQWTKFNNLFQRFFYKGDAK